MVLKTYNPPRMWLLVVLLAASSPLVQADWLNLGGDRERTGVARDG